MNGRLYDPVVGRMLSPDNYAGQDGTTQSYNRYSYALNNPLKFTDPDGENPLAAFLIGAAISGISDIAFNGGQGGLEAWVIGGIQGVVTAGIGEAFTVGGILGHVQKGVGRELLRAGLHGGSSGFFSVLQGGNFGNGFANGAFGSLFGSALGEYSGTTGGTLLGGAAGGAFGSLITGQNVLNGASQGLAIGLLNHAFHSAIQKQPDPPTTDPWEEFLEKLEVILEIVGAIGKGPSALYVGGNVQGISPVGGGGLEAGGFVPFEGDFANEWIPVGSAYLGIGTPQIGLGGELSIVYYTGPSSELAPSEFYGQFFALDLQGKGLGLELGVTGSYSNTAKGYRLFSIGIYGGAGLDNVIPGVDGAFKTGGITDFNTFTNTVKETILNDNVKP